MKSVNKLCLPLFIMAFMMCFAAVASADVPVSRIVLQSGSAMLDGKTVPEYDYVWHADPFTVHDEVKNAPAEYYTGTKPSGKERSISLTIFITFRKFPPRAFSRSAMMMTRSGLITILWKNIRTTSGRPFRSAAAVFPRK